MTLYYAGFWDLQTTSFEIPWFLGILIFIIREPVNLKTFTSSTGFSSVERQDPSLYIWIHQDFYYPKDHWTLKTAYFEDPTPAIQVQTLPLEGPRSLG